MDLLIETFRSLDTACVSDALDRAGIEGGCLGIKPVVSGLRTVGRAFTVRYRPAGALVRGTVGDFLDDVQPGEVVVLDNGGREFCTVWGDIMTTYAAQRGIAGTVIDGVCRDVPKIRQLGYPVFARGHYMVTGKDRVEVDAVGVPVSIGHRQVRPGDIVVADDSGVVVVPAECAEQIARAASHIESRERDILALIAKGKTLREARQATGYHTLQSKNALEKS
jgi:4-hydroxy-4-methyl-2-oxoglutarate aldolase